MEDENLAQIGESYIQAMQREQILQEQEQKEQQKKQEQQQEGEDEFDVKILGNLICQGTDIIFSRIGWEKLRVEEKQLLGDSFVRVVRKRVPGAIKWSDEINLGIAIVMIIITRVGSKSKVEEYKKEYKNEKGKGSSNSSDIRPPRRGKNLFPI